MFNIGGGDKEKLKENMEEIKELINEQEEAAEEVEQAVNQEVEPEDPIETPEPSEIQEQSFEGETSESPASTDDREPLEQRVSEGPQSAPDSTQGLKSKLEEDHVQRPENESEPLFLNVQEFEDVKGMVDEMKYLTKELEDLMSDLQGGVQEDRRIEEEAKEVVQEFSERREGINRTLS